MDFKPNPTVYRTLTGEDDAADVYAPDVSDIPGVAMAATHDKISVSIAFAHHSGAVELWAFGMRRDADGARQVAAVLNGDAKLASFTCANARFADPTGVSTDYTISDQCVTLDTQGYADVILVAVNASNVSAGEPAKIIVAGFGERFRG